ncbi:hypothetical protein [Mesorhizobium sp. M2A.F.Ca.ET.067.02.1.1]|uniref:hypothetical protein n=1 Tax=Mesorhizobium sp. M2A.F.Ca.ET.067.02.1.1 TaxID=2496749 RepID=UPI000FD4B08D|nr:hypothetical protein [Mesorhizobium sp. M2A.F.Ca.ET.067.02.1.1]RUW70517.1 hypothetical protein EOA28_23620 [Mesorhizobium sp. M2A.F.Ca.ET.067.02.1.1]
MQPTMSKGDFARHINVTPGRVSQYISAGMIGKDALEGEGRSAKIIVSRAIEQIRQRRDISQALNNGLSTRLDLDEPGEAADAGDLLPAGAGKPSSEPLKPQTVDDEIKQERLQSERRRNRVAAQEEAEKLGRLVDAGTVRAEMAKLAQAVDDENAGMLADFATAIAAQFSIPQRDVLHLLRRIRNEKKAAAADRARRRAASLPERVEMIVEGNAA